MSLVLVLSSALAAAGPTHAELDAGIPAELTTLLANADSIDRVEARGEVVAFSIASKGEAYRVTATTHDHEIVGVALDDLGAASRGTGAFSWLSRELHTARIAALAIGSDGTVTVVTTSHARLELIRGGDGNASVAARWAAAWDADRSDDSDGDGARDPGA